MPTLNRAKYIPRAVQMWQRQTHLNRELIVIDDGESIEHLLPKTPDVRYFRFEGTLGAKLNFGAQVATGDVLINWDDDDYNAPERIEVQLAHMRISGKPFVGFSNLVYWKEGEEFGNEYSGDSWYTSGSCHAYRRDYALKYPRPDKTLGEDTDACALARKNGALSTISGVYCLVACTHDANCSPKLIPEHLQFLKLLGPPDNYQEIPLEVFRRTITL